MAELRILLSGYSFEPWSRFTAGLVIALACARALDAKARLKPVALALLAGICILLPPRPASARSDPTTCKLVATGEASRVVFPASTRKGESTEIKGVLLIPEGQGPFPAVIVLYRYFGVESPYCYREETRFFRKMGYISLLVDSDSIDDRDRTGFYTTGGYTHADQARDAHAARGFLSTRPEVSRNQIGLVGYAYGGGAVLRAISPPLHAGRQHPAPFAVGVAFHPFCFKDITRIAVPLLIVNGDGDLVNHAVHCKDLLGIAEAVGEVQLMTIPAARHNFDVAWLPTYNRNANAKSYLRVRKFLKKYLR